MRDEPHTHQSATLNFLCGACYGETHWSQVIHLGDNTTAFVCATCGAQWQVLFEVTSLEPLHVGTALTKRTVGMLRDGHFLRE